MISVIVCTYNRAPLLHDLLQTLCEQTLPMRQYEVLVVDNASTDATAAVAAAFTQRYQNMRYCHEPRQGLSYARNRGWQEARGEYVAYIDDDCKAPPEWLQVAAEIIQTQAPLEFGGPHLPFFNGRKPHWWLAAYDARQGCGYGKVARYLQPADALIGNNLFLQRAIFSQIAGFDPKLGVTGKTLRYGEDTEIHFQLRQLDAQHLAYYEPRLSVYHLVRPEKLSVWWLLHSSIMHGRASYAIIAQHQLPNHYWQGPFWWWKRLLWPLYALLIFVARLLASWFWRNRVRYPAWQNYLYEASYVYYCAHRVGVWSAALQAFIDKTVSHLKPA